MRVDFKNRWKRKKLNVSLSSLRCAHRLHMAYFWVHSFASLLYLRREKRHKSMTTSDTLALLKTLACVCVFTCLCRSCRCELCQAPRGRLGLDHTAMNIWTIKLQKTGERIPSVSWGQFHCPVCRDDTLQWTRGRRDAVWEVTFKTQTTHTHVITFRHRQCWRPLWPQDVQADAAVAVYIWVINLCCKCYLD